GAGKQGVFEAPDRCRLALREARAARHRSAVRVLERRWRRPADHAGRHAPQARAHHGNITGDMESYMKKISMAVLAIALAACEGIPKPSDRPYENWEKGAAIGAIGGAVIGATAYKKDRTKGAVIGAVGGGLAGAAVGSYMDSQKRDLEKNL